MEKKIKIAQVSEYSFALLMFFLPLWRWVENILLAVLILIFFSERKKGINLTNILKNSGVIFFLYLILRSLLDSQFLNDFSSISILLPLLLIPIFFTNLTTDQLNKGLFFLFLGILVMQIIASAGIIDYYFFSVGKKIRLSNYSEINQIISFERPYLGFFSAINVILAYHFFTLKNYWLYLSSILISLILVIVISARLSFIIVILTLFALILDQIKNKTLVIIPLIVIVLTSSVYLILQKNSLFQRFYAIKKDARSIIWTGAIQQINTTKNYVFGNGGQAEIRNTLLEYYKHKAIYKYPPEKKRFIRMNYNTHNQFLNEFVRGGIFGVFLFVFPFFYLFFRNSKEFNIIAILLLFAIFSFCFVENVLARQKGVYLFALILAITNSFYEKK